LGELVPLEAPGKVLDVAQGPIQWAFGEGGAAWFRDARQTSWTPQPIDTEQDLVVGASGVRTWALGSGGGLWAFGREGWQVVQSPMEGAVGLEAWPGYLAVVGPTSAMVSVDDGATWQERAAGGPVTAVHWSGARLWMARGDGVLRRHEASPAGWKVVDQKLPAGVVVADLQATGDVVYAVDRGGDVWASADRGRRWTTDEASHDDDPLRYLTATPLGVTAVHRSGRASTLALAGEGLVVTLSSGTGPEGADVVDGVGYLGHNEGSVVSRQADGTLLEQRIDVLVTGGHPCGRPFEVDRSAVVAPAVSGTGWSDPVVGSTLPQPVRQALAAAWLADAKAEHASVASFARFVLRLMALGAPAELVADAQQAMADELRHATDGFTLASCYAGASLQPGPLGIDGALHGPGDLVSVAVEVLREGAVGESIGALLAEARRQRARDPQVVEVLGRIARDEAEHARMAWRFLRWAVEQGGEPVRRALRVELESAIAAHTTEEEGPSPKDASWGDHGHLSSSETRRVVRRAVREVVRPCIEALCAREAA
jgi:hypothetical protein